LQIARTEIHVAQARRPSRLLRLGGERRGKQRGSTSQERAPIHHSIT
jgi:hypothetical protein